MPRALFCSRRNCLKLVKPAVDALKHGTLASGLQAVHDAAHQLLQEDVPMQIVEADRAEGAADPEAAQPPEDEAMANLDEESREAMARWQAAAASRIRNCVELMVRPPKMSQDEMITMLQQSHGFKQKPAENHFNQVIYDGKTEGESKTQPAIRMPTSSVGAALRAGCQEYLASGMPDEDVLEIDPNTIFIFFDAFKRDNQGVFEKIFQIPDRKLQKHRRLLYISYEESTFLRRTRARISNWVDMDIVEQAVIISRESLKLQPRQRLKYEDSSNRFNHIGPVTLEARGCNSICMLRCRLLNTTPSNLSLC